MQKQPGGHRLRCPHISDPSHEGYALVLVLVVLAVILLAAAEESSRVVREIRVAHVRAASEQAFYVAEAGFNKIRAEIIVTGAPEGKYLDPTLPQTESFSDPSGHVLGSYTLHVTQTVVGSHPAYVVVSEGVLESGAARRTLAGTVIIIDPNPAHKKKVTPPGKPPIYVWATETAFDP